MVSGREEFRFMDRLVYLEAVFKDWNCDVLGDLHLQ